MSDDPFAALGAVKFSEAEMRDFESRKAEAAAKAPKFGGGIAKIRIEKAGRGGKNVTVLYDFSQGAKPHLDALLAELRRRLAVGGSRDGERLELQGDQRARLTSEMTSLGFKLKGS
jgi:translation initiation factor 1